MAAHYKEQHFLCEDGECLKQQFFTNAFSTDIDYKAHRASKHSKHLSKALTKAARTIDVEVNLVPRHQGRDRGKKLILNLLLRGQLQAVRKCLLCENNVKRNHLSFI